jgi:hypothetical protein
VSLLIATSAAPLPDACIVQAVERSTIEQERNRLEARLQQAWRIEGIGFITSGIAHNFNNILGDTSSSRMRRVQAHPHQKIFFAA